MTRVLLAVLVLTACGKTPTAVERVCYWKTVTGPVLNAQGDTVSTITFRSLACTESK